MTDWTVYTDEQLNQAAGEIGVERNRRSQMQVIPNSMVTLNRDYLMYAGVVPEQDWRQPAGPWDAYPLGWQVRHVDRLWVSVVDFNVKTPSKSPDWEEAIPEDGA